MSDDDLIRRGDALAAAADLYRWSIAAGEELEAAIAALPAVTVRVKPLAWQRMPAGSAWDWQAWCDLMRGYYYAGTDAQKREHEAVRAARILAALEPVAAPDPALRPTMTDMMVDPDTLGAFMEANPLPPDPAAIREAALLADLAQGPMRGELMEPWIRRMMNRAAALIQKGTTDDHA